MKKTHPELKVIAMEIITATGGAPFFPGNPSHTIKP
jgi:hypothetical protein